MRPGCLPLAVGEICGLSMEEELRELREKVTQLRADNERLRQEQSSAHPGPSGQPSVAAGPLPSTSQTSNEYAALPERPKVFKI